MSRDVGTSNHIIRKQRTSFSAYTRFRALECVVERQKARKCERESGWRCVKERERFKASRLDRLR